MVKKARDVIAGDVILRDGLWSMVEFAYTDMLTRSIKVHNSASILRLPTNADILIRDTDITIEADYKNL